MNTTPTFLRPVAVTTGAVYLRWVPVMYYSASGVPFVVWEQQAAYFSHGWSA